MNGNADDPSSPLWVAEMRERILDAYRTAPESEKLRAAYLLWHFEEMLASGIPRTSAQPTPFAPLEPVTVGALHLDTATRDVSRDGVRVASLTHTECRLLHLLMSHAGHLLTAQAITEAVWGDQQADTRRIKEHISNLRAKIEPEPRKPRYVVTVPGMGYTFMVPDSEGSEREENGE